jgi:pimeloyl-ACP methyl ester carboxylesterase
VAPAVQTCTLLAPVPVTPQGVVVCVPGAGGFPAICDRVREAVEERGAPVAVEVFEWGHGYGHILIDHVDACHTCVQGRRLAERVCALKQECPQRPVYIVSHSAGCAVALAAAQSLPPGSLERLVLLAPAVSATYDLRPALTAVSRTVEVFYSYRDWAALGIGVVLAGTSDRLWTAAAGRIGFRPAQWCPQDEALYAKLRQHPWHPCVSWSGNAGGHYGAYQPAFLRAYVLPLIRPDVGPS